MCGIGGQVVVFVRHRIDGLESQTFLRNTIRHVRHRIDGLEM